MKMTKLLMNQINVLSAEITQFVCVCVLFFFQLKLELIIGYINGT